jgi:GH35 family endo-1,4-beta-xylanase
MKIQSIVAVLLATFLLASCEPEAKVVPTETIIPASTITPIPPTSTITPTRIPIIDIDGQSIPDPHFSNPELFDLQNSASPIPQFVNSMEMADINLDLQQVADGILLEYKTSIEGKPYVIGYYDLNPLQNQTGETFEGKTPLFMAAQDESGKWTWKNAGAADLARRNGYKVGTVVEPSNLDNPLYRDLILNFANIVENDYHLERVLRPGTTIQGAIQRIKESQSAGAGELDPNLIFDFREFDDRIRFINENNMQAESQPLFAPWLFADEVKKDLQTGKMSESDFELFLQFYTKSLVERYNGHVDPLLTVNAWVVGNEVTGNLLWGDAETKWVMSAVVNNGTLARMFISAKEANPSAELIFAEDNLFINRETDLRRKFLQVVDALIQQGAPLDSIAVQNHLWLGQTLLSPADMEDFFRQLEQRNLKIHYNEITISQSQENPYTGESVASTFSNPYRKQAEFLQAILKPMKARKGMVIFYSICDTPGPFDQYNLNDPTAKAVMFSTGGSTSFAQNTTLEPRPMYYVLLQFLMEP